MRDVISISLPKQMVKDLEKEIKVGGFATKSEFFRNLIRMWNTNKLAKELEAERREFGKGKGKILKSLADLE